jgi:hypothetical protein
LYEKWAFWETIVKGTIDSTWIFLNWEGVSQIRKHTVNLFQDAGSEFRIHILSSCSSEQHIKVKSAAYKICKRRKQGYQFSKSLHRSR